VHARKRGVESFGKREKMSREGKIKRKVCVWKRKKKINICMREWKREEKEKRGVAIKI
jgi:hypothetical protein